MVQLRHSALEADEAGGEVQGEAIDRPHLRKMTFGDAVDLYETTVLNQKRKAADGKPRRSTLDDGLKLGKLEKHFGPEKPVSVVASPASLSEFQRVMLQGRRANSVNRYMSILRAVLNRAYEAGGLLRRPEVKALKVNDRREVYLTEDQEKAAIPVPIRLHTTAIQGRPA